MFGIWRTLSDDGQHGRRASRPEESAAINTGRMGLLLLNVV